MWIALLVAIVTLVATLAVTTTADPGRAATSAVAVSGPAVDTQEFLNSLAEQGYIPGEAVDRRRLLLERAVAAGDVPAAALRESTLDTGSPFTPGELLMIEAVRSGQVPREALGAELLDRLDEAGSRGAGRR